jgi:hypothetical protein
MKRPPRTAISIVLALLMAVPVSIVATLLLLPLWRWIEVAYGIESIGHSGPAEWCYFAVFAPVALGSLMVIGVRRRQRPSSGTQT